MARLPFNPDDVPDRPAPKPARRERKRQRASFADLVEDGGGPTEAGKPPADALTVTGVAELVKATLADHTPQPLRIVGEISNCRERNGHLYLTLKDETNNIDCVMWASTRRRSAIADPKRGQQVLATGRLDFYGPQGKLQVYLDRLDPLGQGALEQKFRELCDQLREQGYFEEQRKRPLPVFPERIVAITSGSGAALQDVLNTAHRRWPGVRIDLIDVRVQGADAAGDIAAAIDAVSRERARLGIDAIVLTRGGGSLEDLWAFNEPVVADAVYRAAVPVVAAIGHEVDTTIAELVADLRCSTPTQAAERLVPDVSKEREQVSQLSHRLRLALRRLAEAARARLEGIRQYDLFRRPMGRVEQARTELRYAGQHLKQAMGERLNAERQRLAEHRGTLAGVEPKRRLADGLQRLTELQRRLHAAMNARCQRERRTVTEAHRRLTPLAQKRVVFERRQLGQLTARLESVGPMRVLQRAFTYTTDADGRVIRSAEVVSEGDTLVTHFHDGRRTSRVGDDASTDNSAQPAENAPTTDSPPSTLFE